MADDRKTCTSCRHHRVERHPKVIDAAFDTVVAFADEDERIYFCTASVGPHAGAKVGPLAMIPEHCDAWSEPRPLSTELDRLLARAAERAERASKEEDR